MQPIEHMIRTWKLVKVWTDQSDTMLNNFFQKKNFKNEIKIDDTSHQYLKSRLVFEETF